VVTEISYNSSEDPGTKYRAEIEFIQPSDWEKDLRMSLAEFVDGVGNPSGHINKSLIVTDLQGNL